MAGTPGTRWRRLFLRVVILAGVLTLVTGLLVRLIDLDRFRPEIVAAVSQATGLPCRLQGPVRLGLWPDLRLHLHGLSLGSPAKPVFEADGLTLAARLLPLLQRDLELSLVRLTGVRATLVRRADGSWNLPGRRSASNRAAPLPIRSLSVSRLRIEASRFNFVDQATATTLQLDHAVLDGGPLPPLITDRRPSLATGKDLLAQLAVDGKLAARSLRLNRFALTGIESGLSLWDGSLRLAPLTSSFCHGTLRAGLTIDSLAASPRARLRLEIAGLDLDRLWQALETKGRLHGRLKVAAELEARPGSAKPLLATLAGPVTLEGDNLILTGVDLDTVLGQYEKSQRFDLLDLGAFFLVGPLGPLLGQAYDLTATVKGVGKGEQTRINRLLSSWQLRQGQAEAKDVALATSRNRLALRGGLDLVDERFQGVEIALLDPKGCARIRQRLEGSFHEPRIETTSLLTKTVVKPVLSLLRQGKELLTGKERCQPFYQGRVAHPTGK